LAYFINYWIFELLNTTADTAKKQARGNGDGDASSLYWKLDKYLFSLLYLPVTGSFPIFCEGLQEWPILHQ
jgi:hypothetical protein